MTAPTSHDFHPTSLREYDIRGIIGETLGEDDAYAIGRGFGTLIARDGGTAVATGRDGRTSSPVLEAALIRGLNDAGINAISVGMGPTPMLYYAESVLDQVQGGIMITGSHNPANYNGFKMVFQGRPFFGADIMKLGTMASEGDWDDGSGTLERIEIEDEYVERLLKNFTGGAFKVAWDCGNGAAGPVIEKLTKLLTERGSGEHHLLYTDVDGTFPNHHPDPTEEKNLVDLQTLVAEKNLDFGVAFDGDGDRIGAIDGEGRVIWGDQLLQIYAEDVLKSEPGATIIADVKASQALYDRVAALGGEPLMWKTGHSLIKSKMKETGSPLAGEMSGHVFFKHDYYGFDDAPYAAIRLIQAATNIGKSVTQLRSDMVEMINTPEMRFQVDESRKFPVIDEVLERLSASGAEVNDTDGARVNTEDGWWLLRASNTQDVLVARAEAKSQEGLDRLMAQIDEQLALSGLERGEQAGH
ncbi:phosphoglucomutase/phosphomannomutase PgmG [Parasphingorhabdus sp.]|uniref:phosphoglucomutase/phosphomannomutase PgmG n=1 Tax=Parasphingorhabdus sp. TaxID=2709688 RepID=UPI003A8EDA6F